MHAYDMLSASLRQWLAQAALPWSPASAQRIWKRARQRSLGVEEALRTLSQAEAKTLSRDKYAIQNLPHFQSA